MSVRFLPLLLLAGCASYPMVQLGPDALVDPATTPGERAALARALADAPRLLDEKLGPLDADPPLAVFCKDDACALHFAGPPRRSWTLGPYDHIPGSSYWSGRRPTIIIVRSDEGARGHLVHERVHVALGFGRRALDGRPFGWLPLWFHEGLATLIADEPSCAQPTPKGIDDLRRLDRNADWAAYTMSRERRRPTYCQARAEVAAWMERHGIDGLHRLLDAVRRATPFYDVYGPMLTP